MSTTNEQHQHTATLQASTDRIRVRVQAALCGAFVLHTALADWSFRATRTSSLVAAEYLRWTMCVQWLSVAMALWCAVCVAQTPPGGVPASFVPTAGTTVERNAKMQFRHCAKCQRAKPDRARHCRQCGHCVLRRSHHCTLFARCIGFGNYKAFFLAVFYAAFAVGCSLALDALHVAEAVFSSGAAYASVARDVYLLLSMFLSLMALSAFGQHFLLHFQLISNNLTLPELAEKRDGGECARNYELPQREFSVPRAERRRPRNPFMHLIPQNWCAFLGQNLFAWPFPTNYSIEGDGTSFPISNIGH